MFYVVMFISFSEYHILKSQTHDQINLIKPVSHNFNILVCYFWSFRDQIHLNKLLQLYGQKQNFVGKIFFNSKKH